MSYLSISPSKPLLTDLNRIQVQFLIFLERLENYHLRGYYNGQLKVPWTDFPKEKGRKMPQTPIKFDHFIDFQASSKHLYIITQNMLKIAKIPNFLINFFVFTGKTHWGGITTTNLSQKVEKIVKNLEFFQWHSQMTTHYGHFGYEIEKETLFVSLVIITKK